MSTRGWGGGKNSQGERGGLFDDALERYSSGASEGRAKGERRASPRQGPHNDSAVGAVKNVDTVLDTSMNSRTHHTHHTHHTTPETGCTTTTEPQRRMHQLDDANDARPPGKVPHGKVAECGQSS